MESSFGLIVFSSELLLANPFPNNPDTMTNHILYEITDGVATITLNRADRLNALTVAMTGELLAAIERCAGDDAVRCVVLTGAGRAFSAGQDLEEFLTVEGPWSVGEHLRSGYNCVVLALRALEKPVIGKINGVAAGAGLGIALATDLRIASEQASFAPAFIGIGLAPDSGVSWFLQKMVGPAKAFELLATSGKVGAEESLRLGLVNQVVPATELDPTVEALARQLALGPTKGIGLTKRVLNEAASASLADTLEIEAQVQDLAVQTADHKEGVAAFLQKRKPRFEGK